MSMSRAQELTAIAVGSGGQIRRPPLLHRVCRKKEESILVFASNLPLQITITELQAMFHRAGRIVDNFIPLDRANGRIRGFAFVRFATR